MIETYTLSKQYKGMDTPALNSLSLKVGRNEIFGLLGPNGAGKTTLINILTGIIKPDTGKAVINGYDSVKDIDLIKAATGVVPQELALYPLLTVKENLTVFGTLYGLKKTVLKQRIAGYLDLYGLNNKAGTKVRNLSGGMKRRLNIIAGILHKPALLILDEPTAGIDVQSKSVILNNLRDLNSQGTTILYTSHYMDEAEKFCTNIAVIDKGELLAEGKPHKLIEQTDGCNDLEDVFLKLTGRKKEDDV